VTAKEPAPATWHPLFDGKLLDTFRGWRSETCRGLACGRRHARQGGDVDDLVTKEKFGNFELELEWMIGKGGNSGVFLSRYARVRPHLLERTGVSAAR